MSSIIEKYEIATPEIRKNITINLTGDEKTGKTNFLFTAPGPIAYMWTDKPPYDVMHKFASEKIIYHRPYQVLPTAQITAYDKEVQLAIRAFQRGGKTATTIGANTVIQNAMEQIRMTYMDKVIEFKADYYDWLAEPSIRTLAVDNVTTLYSMLMLADFGRASNNNKTDYGAINRDMFELIAAANSSNKIVIFVSHTGKQYVNDSYTGKRERKGWGDLSKWVNMNVSTWFGGDPAAFHLTVENSSHDAGLVGVDLSSDPEAAFPLDFASLATLVFPTTEREEWV